MKSEGEFAGLFRRDTFFIERPIDCQVNKIVPDGGEEHVKRTEEQEANGIDI